MEPSHVIRALGAARAGPYRVRFGLGRFNQPPKRSSTWAPGWAAVKRCATFRLSIVSTPTEKGEPGYNKWVWNP